MSNPLSARSIAIVYDHLITPYGGAEVVLESLRSAFPQATLFTTIQDTHHTQWHHLTKVQTSPLQRLYPIFKKRELLDVCTPITLEQFDFSDYDIVISVTSSAAKGIITSPKQLHVCYLLTPTRYLYHAADELLSKHRFLSLPGINWLSQKVLAYLRWWDQAAVWRPDYVIGISQQVASRTQQFYHRSCDQILYPPVPQVMNKATAEADTAVLENACRALPEYLLVVSRLVPYKRIDLAIGAAQATGKYLVIAGEGSEFAQLAQQAGSAGYVRTTESITQALQQAVREHKSIIFVGRCSESEKAVLLEHCQAFIMPGIEDFGIAALEANTIGKPALIAAESGVAEVLQNGIQGIHFANQNVQALTTAVKKLDATKFNPDKIKALTLPFTREEFVRKFHNLVFAFWSEHSTINQ